LAVTDIIILQSIKGIIVSISINSAYSRTGVTSAIEYPSPTNAVKEINIQYLLIAGPFSFCFQERAFLGSLFQVIQKIHERKNRNTELFCGLLPKLLVMPRQNSVEHFAISTCVQ